MKTNFSVNPKMDVAADTTVFFVSEKESEEKGFPDFKGSKGSIHMEYEENFCRMYVGTGKQATQFPKDSVNEEQEEIVVDRKVMAAAVNAAIAKAIDLKRDSINIQIPEEMEEVVIIEAMKATYSFDKYKTEKPHYIKDINFFGTSNHTIPLNVFERSEILAKSIELTKDLQNCNASEITPDKFVEKCIGIAGEKDTINIKVLDANSQYNNLGLIKAVGQGSSNGSHLIVMEYKGDGEVGSEPCTETVVLVGKGITYDSGGLSLKPTESMLEMKLDMSGAAIVAGVMYNVSRQKLPINLTVIIPVAENAVGPDSYRVGDVISGYSGKTVEVRNTDAEGRLILADALSYAVDNYDILAMVDVATLTGAVISALGNNIAGVFKSDNALGEKNRLEVASWSCLEDIWELPLNDDIRDGMKSNIADISNMGKEKGAHGSSSAAAFLESFVGDTEWLHIDVAGTAMNNGAGTGWGVELLSKYVEDCYKNKEGK